jgi:hypothetical protein
MSTLVQAPQKVRSVVTAGAPLSKGYVTPVDASAGPLTMTLPTGAAQGVLITVEKVDSSANAVTVSGSIRGSAGTLVLSVQYMTATFIADSTGSWRSLSNYTSILDHDDGTVTIS